MKYIVDDIGKVVQMMRDPFSDKPGEPYYMYGHRVEIARRLTDKDKDKVLKYRKYPLIALRLDTAEEVSGGLSKHTLNIALLALTDKGYNAEQRYEKVFKPILYPMYALFMECLRTSGMFTWTGDLLTPPHTKIDRPYWGVSQGEGNAANIFSDPLDAIEIVNLKLSQNTKKC